MAEDKLKQRIRRALADGKLPAYETASVALAEHYAGRSDYSAALSVYTDTIGVLAVRPSFSRMQLGRLHRMAGEMLILMNDFEGAVQHVEAFLRIAQQQNDAVEEQRAYTTIGRMHLMNGQCAIDNASKITDPKITAVLRLAETAFQRSLSLCKRLPLDNSVKRHERIDMQARAYLNIGVTSECLGQLDATEQNMERALQLCRDHGLNELLHQCYLTTASFAFNKRADTTKALRLLSLAQALADQRGDRQRHCEALSLRADIFIRSADFQSARQALLRAYKLNTPNAVDRPQIERQLRTVVALCQAEDRLVTTASSDHVERRRLFELLGDGASQLKNFDKALDYYGMMLASWEKSFRSERELVPCYVSLYTTFMDVERYDEALVYLRKEYELVRDSPAEAVDTLLQIAQALAAKGSDFWAIDEVLMEARQMAGKLEKRKKETLVVQRMIDLRTEHKMLTLAEVLRDEATAAGIVLGADTAADDDNDDDTESEATQKNTLDIGGDIDLDALSDSEADEADKRRQGQPKSAVGGDSAEAGPSHAAAAAAASESTKRRARRMATHTGAVKRNEKGETALHQACIAGNETLVRRLLDQQSHPVNVRDFAGWLPLHEAANHGHADVVRLLIERGAWINDKGGKMCDGVTALHDACGNGCLEVVAVLLDAGANATMRTDLCETPLDTLEKWRRTTDEGELDATERALYDQLRGRLLQQIERTGGTRTVVAHQPTTKTRKAVPETPPRATSTQMRKPAGGSSSAKQRRSNQRRRRSSSASSTEDSGDHRTSASTARRTIDTMLADEFATQPSTNCEEYEENDDDDDDLRSAAPPSFAENRTATEGAADYLSVMAALRKNTPLKRYPSASSADEAGRQPKRRAGILGAQEVGENWLDDDIAHTTGPKKAKLLTLGSSSAAAGGSGATRFIPRSERPKQKENSQPSSMRWSGLSGSSSSNFNGFSGQSSVTDDSQSQADAFDVLMNPASNKVTSSTVGRQRRTSVTSCKGGAASGQRNSLLHAGFVQFRTASASMDADEDTDENIVSSTRMDCEPTPSANVSASSTRSVTAPIIPKIVAGTTFKVRVSEQLLNVPVNNDMIADLTIGWLAEETSRRYYNLKGLQPVLQITSSDGAAFENSDPLSVVLGSTVGSNVLEWILPSVMQRYMESCRLLQCVPDEHIKSTLELIQAIHHLHLTNQPPLRSELCRPLFRAIHHQTNINTIDLSGTCLEDDGFRHMVDAIDTIRPKALKLSGIQITAAGLAYLTKKLTAAPVATQFTTTTQQGTLAPATSSTSLAWSELQSLDLSYNSLGSAGGAELQHLLEHLPSLRSLTLCSTGLRQLTASGKLLSLTTLDISYNEFSVASLRKLLAQLNACKLAELRMAHSLDVQQRTSTSAATGARTLAEFLQSGTLDGLRVLDISGWQLDDSDVYEVVHALRRAAQLDALWAQENRQLGAIGFVQMVRQVRAKRLYVDGCPGVLQHLGGENRAADLGNVVESAAVQCRWVRLSHVRSEEDGRMLREFWTSIHGTCATMSTVRRQTVLEVAEA